MIRYAWDEADVRDKIRLIDPKWLDKAAARTAAFTRKGKFEENSSIWSTVKEVYMRLQNDKCVFCERPFETPDYGKIEFDLEHFRPKSAVSVWPVPGRHKYQYTFDTGTPSANGYYWLAYEPANYAASCKVCNSNLKSDFFPIAGARQTAPGPLDVEKPFLCYPFGEFDDDPEQLVTFIATTAVPAARSGHRRARGQVIIDFFDLNSREQLHRQRAQAIVVLGWSLDAMTRGQGDADDAQIAALSLTDRVPQAGCLRAFRRAWDKSPAFGRQIFRACKAYLGSDAGTAAPAGFTTTGASASR